MNQKKKIFLYCLVSFLLGVAPGYIMTTVKVESHNFIIKEKEKEIKSLNTRIDKLITEIEELKK